ncbi:MAG TPA: T9SS type A sorting domain-containing protein, partial [Chitinophagaceae bacterium]|nr:T9SS type A sorting domain-containing protein [Chitinophagaceae bacterium]
WTTVDNWSSYTAPNYVHADKHTAIFYPGSTTDILVGTDGGIFKTTNGGTNWSDLSNGLAIAQIYRLGTTPQNTDLVISGWQDNGCNKWDGTNWTRVYGADGMEAAIDYTNENTMYEEYQYGGLQRSTNGGTSWSYIAPSSGFWLTPFIIDPVNSSRLYYGAFGSLYKSDNKGTNWSTVKGVSIGDYIMAIAVAPSNNNIVYVAGNNRIMKADLTTNTATNITGTLPTTTSGINYIAVSDTDPNKVWVAMAGYTAGDKVFRTTDGGATWTNVSGTLPNIPVNTIVYHNGSSDRVFIGTDIGVFMIDDSLTDWVVYGKKLPNVMVHELEINYTSNELVAATYGRGIWQTHVPNRTPVAVAAGTKATPQLKANLYPNPTNGLVNISVEDAQGEVLVDVYKITGDKAASYRFNAAAAKNIRLDLSSQPFGNYIVRIQSGDAVTTKTIQLNK